MVVLALSWTLLMLGIGLVGAFAAWLAYRDRRRKPGSAEHLEEFAVGIRQDHGPIPWVLLFAYVGMALAMIGYVIWAGNVHPNY